jgi:hypothetical protein
MADIYTLIELGVAGIGFCFAIYLLRWRDQRRVDRFRQTYEITPNSIGPDEVLNFIRSLSSLPKPKFLGAVSALSFEHYADQAGERFFMHVAFKSMVHVDQLLLEHTGVTLEPLDPKDDVVRKLEWDNAVELQLSRGGLTIPLRIIEPKAAAATMGAPFKNVAEGEAVVKQIQIYPDHARKPTPEDKSKVAEHTFHATIRVGVIGKQPKRMLHDLLAPFHSVESHAAKFSRRLLLDVPGRINRRAGTFNFLIYLNALEVMALLGWPLDGRGKHNARRIPPTIAHEHPGEDMITIGTSIPRECRTAR